MLNERPMLFCFGLGYTSLLLARRKLAQGWRVGGTVRSAEKAALRRREGIEALVFEGSGPGQGVDDALSTATHVLASIPPRETGDPALVHHKEGIARAPALRWLGYLSTIGVYGDRGGAWVDEDSKPVLKGRARPRLEAEASWASLGARSGGAPAQIFRLGGIYGPERNALVSLGQGTARRVVKSGQVFNRIHVEDIATVLDASMAQPRAGRVYNVVDDEPSPPDEVILYAAALMGVQPPPAVAFEQADLSPMARAFYESNRRVRNGRIKHELGVRLAYPTFREGLDALYRDFVRSAAMQPSE